MLETQEKSQNNRHTILKPKERSPSLWLAHKRNIWCEQERCANQLLPYAALSVAWILTIIITPNQALLGGESLENV
jgi:hypothetical protein